MNNFNLIRVACIAIIMNLLLLIGSAFAQSGTAINSTGATPNTSAILDISSTSQGMLIPRMTTAQRGTITVNASMLGLMIFNTDCNALNYYNGAQWITLGNTGSVTTPGSVVGTNSFCNSYTNSPFSVNSVTGATGYNWTVPIGATINSGQGSSSITVTGAVAGNVCVTAFNPCGASFASCTALNVSTAAPSTPVASAATSVTSSGFTANWSASSNSPIYYLLDVSTSSTFASFFGSYNNLNVGNVTTLPITGVSSGTAYYYRIRAYNGCGTTTNSGSISLTIPGVSGAYQWQLSENINAGNPNSNQAYAVCQDASGIYIAGLEIDGLGATAWRIEKRSLSTNALITTFNSTGSILVNPCPISDYMTNRANAICTDGTNIYVVGSYNLNSSSSEEWFLEAYNCTTGAINNTISQNVNLNDNQGNNFATAVCVYGNYVYVGGLRDGSKWSVCRINITTGAQDMSWSNGGWWNSETESNSNLASMITDGTQLYLAGNDVQSYNRWRVEAIPLTGTSTTNGNNWAIYEGGSTPTNASQAFSITGDGLTPFSYVYIGGYDDANGGSSPEWRIEKRLASTDALVTAFGSSGTMDESTVVGQIYAITADANGLYCAGYDNGGGNEIRVESRNPTTGALVTTFGTLATGIVEDNPSSGSDMGLGMTMSSTNLYVVGYDANVTYQEWRIDALWR